VVFPLFDYCPMRAVWCEISNACDIARRSRQSSAGSGVRLYGCVEHGARWLREALRSNDISRVAWRAFC